VGRCRVTKAVVPQLTRKPSTAHFITNSQSVHLGVKPLLCAHVCPLLSQRPGTSLLTTGRVIGSVPEAELHTERSFPTSSHGPSSSSVADMRETLVLFQFALCGLGHRFKCL
jgi:hypothetical protein